jgi:uncharacterized membrane protein
MAKPNRQSPQQIKPPLPRSIDSGSLPSEARGRLIATAQEWQGPLPPPDTLDHFNRVIPNGADRIMALVEREQSARHEHNKQALDAQRRDVRRGHFLGGLLGTLALVGAAGTAYIGAHPTVSVAMVGLPIAAILRSALRARVKKDES